jgi:hypothetical protein
MELRTSDMVASWAPSSESDDDGSAFLLVPLRILFFLSLLASIRAASSRALVSSWSLLMSLRAEGHTRGSADDGFSSTAYATCPRFIEAARCCEAPAAAVGVARGGAQGGGAAASPD